VDPLFLRSLAAGALAGCCVDALLFPLDSVKTRLQAKDAHLGARSLQKIYRGLPVVMMGNSVGSAVFFATYEQSRTWLGGGAGRWEAMLVDSVSAILGELLACTFRTPTEILKQRMQALQISGFVKGLHDVHFTAFMMGFRATALRDLVFSAIQYPAYQHLKSLASADGRQLGAWDSALCGSVTGSLTAVVTTPLDVLKTRIMLEGPHCALGSGILRRLHQIYRSEGLEGLFRGAICRGLWMGLGGLVFLGSYEKAKAVLQDEQPVFQNFAGRYAWSSPEDPQTGKVKGPAGVDVGFVTYRRCWYGGPGREAPGSGCGVLEAVFQAATAGGRQSSSERPRALEGVALEGILSELIAGGIAGCAVDVFLYPIDTLKTRLQAATGFRQAGGLTGLWRGVSVPALAGMPASAVFWAVYAPMKQHLQLATGSNTQAELLSGPVSEMVSQLVRVPSEVLKQRMQAGIHKGQLMDLVRQIHRSEGFCGFYAGFAATCLRSLPFALIQFPVYEELKRRMDAHIGSSRTWWTGAASGALAGGIAAVATTPLDVAKTRIMLAPLEARLSFVQMTRAIVTNEGVRGLFAGVVPRGLYLSLGGMVYLGAYNGVVNYFRN